MQKMLSDFLNFNWDFIYPANDLVKGFLAVMVILAVVDFVSFPSRRWHRDFKSSIVSLGILGTFVGVALGLSEFNSEAMRESVLNLLGGMKIAFQTSIFGMGIAVTLAIVERFIPRFGGDRSQSEKQTLAELLEQTKQQRSELKNSLGSVCETLGKIPAVMDGISEQISGLRTELRDDAGKMNKLVTTEFGRVNASSAELLKQFKEQRTELGEGAKKTRELIGDGFTRTNDVLGKALVKISEGASKEIIKALEESIKGFNKNLSEQFGENFKQLNAACLKLVQWQERHKESVAATHQQLQNAVTALSQTEKSLGTVAKRNKEVLAVYEGLRETIAAYDNQTKALTQHLEKYGNLAEKAEEMFSDADERFKNIAEQISGFAVNFHNKIGVQSDLIKGMIENSRTHFTDSAEALGEEISDAIKESMANMQKTVNAQSQEITNTTQQLAKSLRDMDAILVGVTEQLGNKYDAFLEGARHIAEMNPRGGQQ